MTDAKTVTLEDEERQIVTLALAVLSLRDPGFGYANRKIAEKINGDAKDYDQLREFRADEDGRKTS